MHHLEEYLQYLDAKAYASGTVASYERAIAQLGWWSQKKEQQITAQDMKCYHQHLKTLPIEKNTIIIKLKNIKKYFAYLIIRSYLLIDPTKDLELTYEKDGLTKDILTVKEMRVLLNTPSQSILEIRDKVIMEILYATGIRSCELCALDIQDVNLKENEVHIKDLKNRTERRLPLARQSNILLAQYFLTSRNKLLGRRKLESAVFLNVHGQRLDKQLIYDIIKKYVKRAGIQKHITPHCFRHSCATHMLQNGAPVEMIQQLLGHRHINSTAIYTRAMLDDLKKSIKK